MDEFTSPIKAIRGKCLDCCSGQMQEIKCCSALKCPLWMFRFGKNPYDERSSLIKSALLQKKHFESQHNLTSTQFLKNLEQKGLIFPKNEIESDTEGVQ